MRLGNAKSTIKNQNRMLQQNVWRV